MLNLYRIDENYGRYMRFFDEKAPNINGDKNKRPFVGIVISVGNCSYYAPLSSPKPKHLHMHDAIDFVRIQDGKRGVINFNNMIPVTKNMLIPIDIVQREGDDHSTRNYKNLIIDQRLWCNDHQHRLKRKACTLYERYKTRRLHSKVVKRCCNFELLEKAMKIYDPNYNTDQIRVLKKAIMQNVKLSEIADPDIPAVQMEKILNTDRTGEKEKM